MSGKLEIYSIRDNVVEAFMRPWYAHNVNDAIRSWSQALRDPSSEMAKSASDFTMFRLGTFDDGSGLIVPELTPVRIMSAYELLPTPSLVKEG